MNNPSLLSLLFIIFGPSLFGQLSPSLPIGSPFITNYADDTYLEVGKNWDISQAENGSMYFANNYGLIEFDGYEWTRIGQPNNQSELRSFAINENRIYIGGTAEIGYFEKEEAGNFVYTELNHLIADNSISFNDVWDIAIFKERVFFLTDNGILMYANGSIEILGRGHSFRTSAHGINELVFGANEAGLFRFINNELIPISNKNDFAHLQIEFLLITEPNTYLIGTNTQGVWQYKEGKLTIWNAANQSFFLNNHLRHATILNKDYLLFGSLHKGLILTDYQGAIIKIINESNGLLDHNIRAIYKDKQGNIWTSVDGSIAYLELNSPFTLLNKRNGLRGEVYCILKHQKHLYVGTSRGLYRAKWPSQKFTPVSFDLISKTTGQCWQLMEHQGKILLAHHNGIYVIEEDKANYIGGEGNWNFAAIPQSKNLLLSGNYAGVSLIERVGDTYQVKHQIKGFTETARELVFDEQHNIWVSHGYIGLYKMRLSPDQTTFEKVQLFNKEKGLPSDLYNNIIKTNQGVLFGTQNGVYQYNEQKNILEPNTLFSEILGNKTLIRQLYQLSDGNYLSIKNYDRTDEIALIEVLEDGSFSYTQTPFQKLRGQLIPAFETVNFLDEQQILIGGKQGLIVYNTKFEEFLDKSHQCFITEVSLPSKDSILSFEKGKFTEHPILKINQEEQEAIRFTYSTSFFESLPYMQYATYLEGYDENWQDWTTNNSRVFSNLEEGDYTFWVKSKNIYGKEGVSDNLSFQLEHPTNALLSFLGFFFLLLPLLFYLVYWFINRRTAKKSTTTDYQKVITEFQENLKEIDRQFEAHKTLETDDFLTKIKSKHPDLSARELRLCSYLKLNISSKEIANYLGISIRGVESLRYRVRKKLGLEKGQDLTDFIMSL